MKKVLVTGSSGLLGGKLVKVLHDEYEVVPTHNTESLFHGSIRMDIVDGDEVSRVIEESSPDIVVHAAAETNVDKCETNKDWAWSVNVLGTKNVAEACVKFGAKLIFISTDYVFDGSKGLYREDDEANPINHYGLTKLKGEELVRGYCQDSTIVRPSVVYGWHTRKLNFATWVIDSLRNRKRIPVAEDHYNSPTLADDLSEIISLMIKRKLCGVYHTAGAERASRYEFALKIAETFGLDRSLISPVRMVDVGAWIALRPRDSSLCVDKIKRIGIGPSDLSAALKRMKEQIGCSTNPSFI
ncbi:dTDP-4-dehydrorhamnose reductase [Candidatus Bathyarchaeota archaeon]|nr:dTDP-4-dehydrorhamnose reductase [Candidatus Bathyarchaeota archaeon]